jgi:penicillin-binding protein 2
MAGKTGTAENNAGADHAWFAGYVPADRPRFAFVVVLEHGGSGGRAAGPVARKFVECLLDMGLVTNTTDLAGEQP